MCVWFLYEAIVSAQMPIDTNPIRIDLLLLAPFMISYIIFVVFSLIRIFSCNRFSLKLFKMLLFVSDCIVAIVATILF